MPSPSTLPAILVAEDDPNDFFFLQTALRQAGLKNPLVTFGNGLEVIEHLKRMCRAEAPGATTELPCLLFLDLHLPQIDGCGVIAWARKQPQLRQLRIVVISGSGDSEDTRRALALGASRVLMKPATEPDLAEELARLNQTERPRLAPKSAAH